MTEPIARLAQYRDDSDAATAGAIAVILDVLQDVTNTIGSIGEAIRMLDALDDVQSAKVTALTRRIENLEASRKV